MSPGACRFQLAGEPEQQVTSSTRTCSSTCSTKPIRQSDVDLGRSCDCHQETLNVITRKLDPPVTADHARRFLNAVLLPLWSVAPSAELYRRGLEIQSRYQYGFYDALIIAAALEASCTGLLSEDMQHGQRIEHLTIENPFLGLPPP